MVSQVGLNTTAGFALPALNGNAPTQASNGSVFFFFYSVPTNDYSNDIFMNGINFSQLTSALPVSNAAGDVQAQQPAQVQPSFGNVPQVPETQEEPKQSNWGKITGAIVGALAPIAPKVVKLFNGGKFAELFKRKELLVSCPIFGVVGLGVGMLIDSCLKSRKEQNETQAQAAQQQEIIRDFVNQ